VGPDRRLGVPRGAAGRGARPDRLLSDITRVLSDVHVNILSASVTTTADRVAVSRFTFEMGDPKHLGHLINLVRSVEGVYDAYRVTVLGTQRRGAQEHCGGVDCSVFARSGRRRSPGVT
jgi:hypothetical protein